MAKKLKWFWQHIAKVNPISGNPTTIIAEDGFPNSADKIATRLKEQIGRASCRERV